MNAPLAELQSDFIARLLDESPASEAFGVYRRTVVANLTAAVATAHPVVRRLVGDAFFMEAARQFARECPSRSGDLASFGEGFDQFLAGYAPACGLPYLADVARLEWAVHESRAAADAPMPDLMSLATVPADRVGSVRFIPHPAARWLASAFAIADIWQANQPPRDGGVESPDQPQSVLVTRPLFEPQLHLLSDSEHALLQALADGTRLEVAAEAFTGPAFDSALVKLAAAGAFCGYEAAAG